MAHDCIRIAMEKIVGPIDLESNDRPYQPTEVALALRKLGYAMTMLDAVLGQIDHEGKVMIYRTMDLDPAKYNPCMVEVEDHALAYIDGEYWDGDSTVNAPDQILSLWVPDKIKSKNSC